MKRAFVSIKQGGHQTSCHGDGRGTDPGERYSTAFYRCARFNKIPNQHARQLWRMTGTLSEEDVLAKEERRVERIEPRVFACKLSLARGNVNA